MIHLILLAAGQGLRMGGPNKLLLPFRGRTVLETTLSALLDAGIGPVTVVTGHRRDELLPLLKAYPVREVFNARFLEGMTSSIQAGIAATAAGRGYMICLADMPWISAAVYRQLESYFSQVEKADRQAIVSPRFGQASGNPVLFAAAWRDAILTHGEPEGCRGLVQANAAHVHRIDLPDDSVVRDLDTPEDYAKYAG